ncbi:MocR-like pyridoxine biosynthesis transcription factor PdxR [Stakelama tenebrarum]|uniref:PLP-dependent aminotransferase family protein n=1 Tax=Stakelama tenebrarum TaxID=2711215 RepID=A0A6G6Y3U1_9SPHN|nr:PLP-dependent aminotransferase family protein [Sphingosinithalassobacter tenebrarum]QIG79388.1 PLP-dependent aminotransferase family protein [Sphingosinithalassobacter tenebrarum]
MRPFSFIPPDRIDPSREMPIYMQIARAIIHEVERGRLAPGSYLPSTRDAAQSLGVNRKTVVLAYEELVAQGWLVSHGTRGTAISPSLPGPVADDGDGLPRVGEELAPAEYPFLPPPGPPLAIPTGDWIKLDEGAPDGRQFPPDLLIRAYRAAIRNASAENRLQYRDPRGSPQLRESIAAMLKSQRGLMVTAENICVTRGSQMGISLAARILIRPGDTVLVEALTYEPAVAAFRACGADIVTVGLDGSGADVGEIERACRRHRVRAIFLTPHHQFPTTVALPPESRLRVLELARQFGFAVVEDDYDHEFQFGAQPLLPMASYAPRQVIYIGSLSKLLLPALRVGYVVAPPEVIDSIAYQVSLTDGMGNTLTEDAAADLILSGDVRRHTRKVTRIYGARRDAFAQALATTMGDIVDYAIPDGGLAFWLRFRNVADLDRLEANAQDHGLRFATSGSFMVDPDAPRGLRIGFASMTEAEAAESLRRMRVAIGR